MKNKLKALAAALAVISAVSCMSGAVYADKLKSMDGVVYRYSDSGEVKGKVTGWVKNKRGRFYLKNGLKQTGLVHIGKNWYCIDEKDGMLTGKQTIDGFLYNFGENGKWDKKFTYPDGTAEPYPFDKLMEKLSPKVYNGLAYEDGMCVIFSVDGKAETAVQELFPGLSGIIYRPVRYSQKELEIIREKLAEELDGKWYGHGIDIYKNKIVFDVDERYLDEVQKYIEDNGYSEYALAEKGYPITLV